MAPADSLQEKLLFDIYFKNNLMPLEVDVIMVEFQRKVRILKINESDK